MGGMIVQEYALAYPEDLRSVIMACTYVANLEGEIEAASAAL